ncbi:hypothetical protein [Flavobacterium sp. '19STA2R22 D10 B1']|uniref:hypothetical protein n=1 Tax=Flavobacterium aerium TaxID=3037261 RepID=UPI00278C1422|nr:hypothetical protein [Flavobacterium sp. '19STA2R22 D10 B1']
MDDITIITGFVTGEITASEFENILYESDSLNTLFSQEPAPSWSSDMDLYLYLISQDYHSASDLLNIQDVLSKLLVRQGIVVEKSDDFQNILHEKAKLLPKWLSITDKQYNIIRKGAHELKGKEFDTYIKDHVQKNFISLNKPPRWLQDAYWPIHNDIPLIFIGQLDIAKMRNDEAYAYIFYNQNNQTYQTIEQSM